MMYAFVEWSKSSYSPTTSPEALMPYASVERASGSGKRKSLRKYPAPLAGDEESMRTITEATGIARRDDTSARSLFKESSHQGRAIDVRADAELRPYIARPYGSQGAFVVVERPTAHRLRP